MCKFSDNLLHLHKHYQLFRIMEFKDIVAKRRSVRKFSDEMPSDELIQSVIDAALAAPTSRNSHSTHLYIVRDRETIERLSTMRDYGSAFIAKAPVVVLVAGDTSKSDLWSINCAIAATTMQLACVDCGLSSCWVHVENRPQKQAEPDGANAMAHIRKVIDLPQDHEIMCAIAMGHSDFEPAALPPFEAAEHVKWM